MMIISELYRGKIYAGDTPLESTLSVEQTGPLQLTVRKGHLQTTGQARIVHTTKIDHVQIDQLLQTNKAEMADAKRLRLWLNGHQKKRHDLIDDFVWDIIVPSSGQIRYWLDVGTNPLGRSDVLINQMDPTMINAPVSPPGWSNLQTIIFPFVIAAGMTILPDIIVLTVEPGYPPPEVELASGAITI